MVTAPKYVAKEDIEKLLIKKANWVLKKQKEQNFKTDKPNLYKKEEFIQIIEKTAKELICKTGIKPNKIRIREIKYAWGSCSSNKNITINLKLIGYSKEAIRYVILHELCHIKHMNHSKKFWELIETYMPNYKEVKKELK
ncbi:MAG: M48 family metallopeptidase [Clostridia bacterium]|nr:M48 family metallopeptidase [Clostridia bacterium]